MTIQQPIIVLLGGCSGSGKTLTGRTWAELHPPAAHFSTDDLVSGMWWSDEADLSAHAAAVAAIVALGKALVAEGCSCVLEDVFDPYDFEYLWKPLLKDVPNIKVAILDPGLEVAAQRDSTRPAAKGFDVVAIQHAAIVQWPESMRIFNSRITPEEAVELIDRLPMDNYSGPGVGDVFG